jgi:hypothetical protein
MHAANLATFRKPECKLGCAKQPFCGRTPHCAVGFVCDTTFGVSLINTHNVRWTIWDEEVANGSTTEVVSRWPRCTWESVFGLWPMGRVVENVLHHPRHTPVPSFHTLQRSVYSPAARPPGVKNAKIIRAEIPLFVCCSLWTAPCRGEGACVFQWNRELCRPELLLLVGPTKPKGSRWRFLTNVVLFLFLFFYCILSVPFFLCFIS